MNSHASIRQSEVSIPAAETVMEGMLSLPGNPTGIVAFAHGSGSSRFSPRNRFVAESLNDGNLATLLFDLLTAEEQRADEVSGHLRFDIELLALRLTEAVDWLGRLEAIRGVSIGLFGASTGAAAAPVTAARGPIWSAPSYRAAGVPTWPAALLEQ